MEAYHESFDPTSNPYANIPPIGRLLATIRAAIGVGGCYRPGNRDLARRVGVSAGHITPLLDQLVSDGWIAYDRASGVITLRGDPKRDHPPIPNGIADDRQKATDPARDRVLPHTNAHRSQTGSPKTPESSCKEEVSNKNHDSDLVVTYESDPDPDRDRALAARQMEEFGAYASVIREAFKARPDWTAAQVRDRWAYDQKRIAADPDRLNSGVFFTALKAGQLAPAPSAIGFDPEAYRGRPEFFMGGDEIRPTLRDRAQALAETVMGKWTANNHAACVQASMFLERQIEAEKTEIQALMLLDMEITR